MNLRLGHRVNVGVSGCWGCETGCEEDGNFTDTENKTITREGAAEEALGHQLGGRLEKNGH